jgi:hypothetical protein
MIGVAAVVVVVVVVVVVEDAPPPPPHPHIIAPDNTATANIFKPARIRTVLPFRRRFNPFSRRTP